MLTSIQKKCESKDKQCEGKTGEMCREDAELLWKLQADTEGFLSGKGGGVKAKNRIIHHLGGSNGLLLLLLSIHSGNDDRTEEIAVAALGVGFRLAVPLISAI